MDHFASTAPQGKGDEGNQHDLYPEVYSSWFSQALRRSIDYREARLCLGRLAKAADRADVLTTSVSDPLPALCEC